VSPVRYKLGCYIPVDDILHSHRSENLKVLHSIVGDHKPASFLNKSEPKIRVVKQLKYCITANI
jgi:hypothetical protein